MTTNLHPASRERADLATYIKRNTFLLTQPEILDEAKEYYRQDTICYSIGELAHHLTQVGEDEAALRLVDRLLDAIDDYEDAPLQTWAGLAERGAKIADGKLRASMGLTYDEEGNTVMPPDVDIRASGLFTKLLALYQLGDKSLIPYLHQNIEGVDDAEAQYAVASAVKLYEAGDESAYELVKTTAERARQYVFAQQLDEEQGADASSEAESSTKEGMIEALSRPGSKTERAYSYVDGALKTFAKSLIEKGDIRRADEIQALMLSRFDNAWLNAQRVALGHDHDGKYAQAAKDYLAVYVEDSGRSALEITNALVRGGDAEVVADYETIYDPSLNLGNTYIAADMLVALHHSGDQRAHGRLIELVNDPKDAWRLIMKLQDMGLEDEAAAIAKKAFDSQPSYDTGLNLLNIQYDRRAMEAVQDGASQLDRSLVDIVASRSRHLGKLAAHILEIEGRS